MIYTKVTGPRNVEKTLLNLSKLNIISILNRYGQEGASALATATPKDSGLAAQSWGYDVSVKRGSYTIVWTNTDVEGGFPVVIMLQYGHGTGTGGFVQGIDFINPAIKPIFDRIESDVWKAVTSA
jgi:hypothetical protein